MQSGCSKRAGSNVRRKLYLAILGALSSGAVNALPQGGQVTAGEASISVSDVQMDVHQESDRVVIEYDAFDVGASETVNFHQPDSHSVALNRVIGNDLSSIHGRINANGQVFLINPNGVLVGEGAQIDVGGLMATTLDIHNQEFLEGGGRFQGDVNGRVENQGRIRGQSRVILLAPEVINSGEIHVEAGDITLASGAQALLQTPGSDIPILIEDSATLAHIQNSGALSARELSLIAAGVGGIHNSGTLRATRAEGSGGEIRLRADSGDIYNAGTVDASAQAGDGGLIVIQADRYAQTGELLASGEGVGSGGDVSVNTRDTLVLHESALIGANAGREGDGGEVIVYSEGRTAFTRDAAISARGGAESGDGGFVEVSGAEFVFVDGQVDVAAVYGQAGTWYIDPSNITIDGVNGDSGSFVGPDPFNWDHGVTPPSDSIININTLRNTLINGNVIIDTASASNGAGNISWNAQLNIDGLVAGRTLTLIADNNIQVQGGGTIFDANPGVEGLNIELYASNNVQFNPTSAFGSGTGTIRIEAGNNITLAGLHSESTADNAVYLQAGNQILQDGDNSSIASAPNGGMVLVSQNGMDIDGALGDTASIGFQNLGSGDINYNASGDLVLNSLALGANMSANISATGNLTFTGTEGGELDGATNSNINFTAGGLITINGSLADTVGAVDNSTHFTALSTNGFIMADGVELNMGSGLINISTTSGGVTVSGLSSSSNANNAISLSATAGSISDAGDSNIDLSALNGGVVLNAPDGISDLEIESASADAQASAGNTSLNFQGGTRVLNLVGADSNLTATGDLIFDDGATLTADSLAVSTSGNVVVPDAGLNSTSSMVLSAADFDNTSGTRDVILIAPNLNLSTQASGGDLNFSTAVDTLAISNSGTNSVSVTDVDALNISSVDVSSGDIQLASSAGADLVIAGDIDLNDSSANLSLHSTGDLQINNQIADLTGAVGNSGNVNLSADNSLSFANTARVDAGTGNVSASSLGGDLALGEVAGNNITLSSSAAITDANGNAVNINATQASVTAGSNIASAADTFETTLNNLSINAVNADISEVDGLILDSLNVSGNLSLTTGAAGDVSISQSSPTVDGTLSINANDGDLIFNDAGLNFSGDFIVFANALRDSDNNVSLLAADVDLTLASSGADTFITSNIDSLLINVLGSQSFQISDANALVVNQANSAGDLGFNAAGDLAFNDAASSVDGNLSLISGAMLTVPDSGINIAGQLLVDAQNIQDSDSSIDLVAGAADIQLAGNSDVQLNTRFDTLALQWNGGSALTLNESDALSIADIVGAGSVAINAGAGISITADAVNQTGTLALTTPANIQLLDSGFSTQGTLQLDAANIVDTDRSINLQASQLDLVVRDGATASTFNATTNSLDLDYQGSAAVSVVNSSALTVNSINTGGDAALTTLLGDLIFDDVSPSVAGDMTLAVAGDLTIPTTGLTTGGNLTLSAETISDDDASVSLGADQADITLRDATASTTLNSSFNELVLNYSGNTVSVVDSDALTVNAVSATGDVLLASTNSDLTLAAENFAVGGALTLQTLGAGNLVLPAAGFTHSELNILADSVVDDDSSVNLFAAAANIELRSALSGSTIQGDFDTLNLLHSGSDLLSIADVNDLVLQSLNANGELSVRAEGALTLNASAPNFVGELTLSSGGDFSVTALLDLAAAQNNSRLNIESDQNLLFEAGSGVIDSSGLIKNLSFNLNAGAQINLADGVVFDIGNSNQLNTHLTAGTDIQMAASSGINAGLGTLNLVAGGDIVLAGLQSANTGDAISLQAGGAINSSGDLVADVDTLGNVQLLAATGINDLEVNAATIAAQTSAGDISLNSNNELYLAQLETPEDAILTASNLVQFQAAALVDVQNLTITTDDLGVSDSGLAVNDLLTVNSTNIRNNQSNADVSLAASRAHLNVVNTGADVTWQTDFNELRLNHQGAAHFSLINQGDLNVQDLQSGGDLSLFVNGNIDFSGVSAVENLNIATLGNGVLQVGSNGLSARNAIVINVAELPLNTLLSANSAELAVRNGTQPVNVQAQLSDFSLQVGGSAPATVNAGVGLVLSDLSSLGDITVQSDGPLQLGNASADVQGTLSLLSQNDILFDAQTFTNSGALALTAVNLQDADGGAMRFFTPRAEITLSGDEALILDGDISNLALSVQSSENLQINNSGDLFVESLLAPNAPQVEFSIAGLLGFANDSVSVPGDLNLFAQNFFNNTGRFTAQNLTLGLSNAIGQYQWQVETNNFDLDLNGPASAQISSSQTLTLRDNNGDGLAVDIEEGSFTVLSGAGDINVEGDVIARDLTDDGVREGVIDLQAAGGDINIGLTQAASVISQNLVDQDVGNTLQESGGIKLQLRDTSSAARVIRIGNGVNAAILTAIGGDVLLDTGINNTPVGSERSVIESASALILAYNLESDSANGSVQINGQDVTQSGGQLIRSGRTLVIADSRELQNEKFLDGVDDVDGTTDIVEQEQDQGMDIAAQYEKAYGSCNELDDPSSSKCRIDHALKAFLSHWLVGGELPPKSEIR